MSHPGSPSESLSLESSRVIWHRSDLLLSSLFAPCDLRPSLSCSLVRCGFLLIFVEWSGSILTVRLWSSIWWDPAVFCRGVLVSLERRPSLLLSCSEQALGDSGLTPRALLSKGVDTRLRRAIWEFSEVSCLKQLALTEYLARFRAPLQIRWAEADYLMACGETPFIWFFSPPR